MIKIGVSACLLGENVRYDGKNKNADLEKYFDTNIYKLIPICPEVEMGMSIPRAPIQIINDGDIKLVQVDNQSINYTQQMETWFDEQKNRISRFSGLILKSKSPSCGHQTTAHFQSKISYYLNDGLFVILLKQHSLTLAITDEHSITNQSKLTKFIHQLQ